MIYKIDKISKTFGGNIALDNISMEFERGKIHCLLGENGAGKSTIGRICAGILQPDRDDGSLTYFGQTVEWKSVQEARKRGVLMVHQELSLLPDLTVVDNIALGGIKHKIFPNRRAEHDNAKLICDSLDLDVDLRAPISSIAVAEQQLIEIARSLMIEPKFLILDEPTSLLSLKEKRVLFRIVERLKAQGVTICYITHHLDEVLNLGDIVHVMRDGKYIDRVSVTEDIDHDYLVCALTGRDKPLKVRGRDKIKRNLSNGGNAWEIKVPARVRVRQEKSRKSIINISNGEIVALYGVPGSGYENVRDELVGKNKNNKISIYYKKNPYKVGNPRHAFKEGVIYLPAGRMQNGIFIGRSLYENCEINILSKKANFGLINRRVLSRESEDLLDSYKVKRENSNQKIEELSGGNQQKVLLARVLREQARLYVICEPTAGIDIGAKTELYELLLKKKNDDGAMLLISNDLLDIEILADRVYTFYSGLQIGVYNLPLNDESRNSITADVIGSK